MFEARITTAVALSTKCEGVNVVKLVAGRKINNPTKPTWFLKIDNWELGKGDQPIIRNFPDLQIFCVE